MILSVIEQWNWVDIFVIILLFRISYIAIKSGLAVELFKFLGTILAVYLSLHYYMGLSDFVKARLGNEKLSLEFLDFSSFLILVTAGYAVFVFLRRLIFQLIKIEAVSVLNKWLGLFLGIARGFLVASLIIFILVISNMNYLKKSAENSYSGRRLFKLATNTYSGLWHGLMSKFMTGEKFNKAVLEAQESFAQK